MIPGEKFIKKGEIELNKGRRTVALGGLPESSTTIHIRITFLHVLLARLARSLCIRLSSSADG